MTTDAPKPAEATQPAEATPSEQAILAGLGAPIEHAEGAPIPGTEPSGPIRPTHTTGAQ
ncbi:hypothetical protein ACFY1P_13360 [Streptomyces sp. NPDC001407]|uniref:hypothetical protein n=1 Tax=unclassified Streptomyces TaxID=2593676 RepID=UPI0033E37420